jgi:hypothetical protein
LRSLPGLQARRFESISTFNALTIYDTALPQAARLTGADPAVISPAPGLSS